MFKVRSQVEKAILGFLLFQPDEEFYINELARILKLDPGNLFRKLVELEKGGILLSRRRGNQKYYSLNNNFPLIEEYKKLIHNGLALEKKRRTAKSLPDFFKGVLWSYDIEKMDIEEDKERIITNTLIYGSEQATEWIFTNYPLHEIRNVVMNPRRGEWDKKSLFFWAKTLELPLAVYKKAIQDLKV